MKVTGTVRAQVLAKNTTKSQDGKNTYYNLAVLIGGEAGNLKCLEDVFDCANVGEVTDFGYEFNEQYNTFRLVTYIGPVRTNSPTSVPTPAEKK